MICIDAFLLSILLAMIWCATGLNFKWTASIDRSTGIAASQEVSRVPPSCNLHQALASSSISPSKLAKNVLGRYPSWLAHWWVTFGFLRADKTSKEKTSLSDSLIGVNLLSFGAGKFRVAKRRESTEYNMMIPIVGGILALHSAKGTCGSLSFSFIQDCHDKGSVRLQTGIVDGYRPSIAGMPPVCRLRAGIYRSTQSILHTYIMWRFHHYCYQQDSM